MEEQREREGKRERCSESSGVVCRADLGALGSQERLCLSGWASAGSVSFCSGTQREKAALRLGALWGAAEEAAPRCWLGRLPPAQF